MSEKTENNQNSNQKREKVSKGSSIGKSGGSRQAVSKGSSIGKTGGS